MLPPLVVFTCGLTKDEITDKHCSTVRPLVKKLHRVPYKSLKKKSSYMVIDPVVHKSDTKKLNTLQVMGKSNMLTLIC